MQRQSESDDGLQPESQQPFAKKFKHTLDSDEEDDEQVREKYDVLEAERIEGEEDGDVRHEDEIRITPFNMKEELEEGHFDREGMFIFDKEGEEVKDHWLENIDWVKVQERPVVADPDSDQHQAPQLDVYECYRNILSFLTPGESVQQAIRRLGQRSSTGNRSGRRVEQIGVEKIEAARDSGAETDGHEAKQQMLTLITHADQLISSGDMDAYERTYEQLTFRLNTAEKRSTRDMFAEEENEVRKEPAPDSVHWQLKWSESEDAEVHGPFTNDQMIQWRDAGYFANQAFVRQTNKPDASFHSVKRIDFDLYS